MHPTQNASPATASTTSPRAAVRRVQISDATPTQPPHIRVTFRDIEAAKHGYAQLPPMLAADTRTELNLAAPMPTLTYPVIAW